MGLLVPHKRLSALLAGLHITPLLPQNPPFPPRILDTSFSAHMRYIVQMGKL